MYFRYRLTGMGWAEASVEIGDQTLTLTASYLEDALGDLLEAVGTVLEGADSARCLWEEEPGEFRWLFNRTDEVVRLRILAFADMYSLLPDERGRLLFDASAPVRTLATAIADGARLVLNEHGEDGYLQKWIDFPFPTEYLTLIEQELART